MDLPLLPSRLSRRFLREWQIFCLAAVLLMLLALWRATGLGEDQGRASLQAHAADLARGHAGIVETLRNKFALLPAVLARDETVRRALAGGAAADIQALNSKFDALAQSIGANVLYLLDAQGKTLASSNWQAQDSFVDGDFRFRPYFTQAMAQEHAEYFALGASSGQEGLYISRRVPDAEGGADGVVVVKLAFTGLEQDWQRHGDRVLVTDPQGVILLSSQPAWRFHTLSVLPQTQRQAIRASRQFGEAALQPLSDAGATDPMRIAGKTYLRQPAPIPGSAWTLHILTAAQPTLAQYALRAQLAALATIAVTAALAALGLRHSQRRRSQGARQAARQSALQQAVDTRTQELHLANRRLEEEMAALQEARARARTLREQLAQAEKLSFLGQITAGVAHEVNQPVTAIQTYVDNATVLLERGNLDQVRNNLTAITHLTQRIGVITAQLRRHARKPAEPVIAVPVRAALDNALMLLGPRARAGGVEIDLNGVADGLIVHAGQARLEQIFVNLIRNALDAVAGRPQGRVTISAARDASVVRICVRDNGPGISDSVRSTLFTPFSTSRSEGLGLGLAISRDLVLAMGGTLHEQPSDDGAMFIITLPDPQST